jgi:large subunit ribosomal protein L6
MSRIGEKPIAVPAGVTVKLADREVTVSGPKGTCTWVYPATADVSFDEAGRLLTVKRRNNLKASRANHGLTRALINNMVVGVFEGFQKRLLIYGTGYSCKLDGDRLRLNLGYSGRGHGRPAQFELPIPKGLEAVVERDTARGDNEPASVVIRGYEKQKVGQFAAEIRALRKTEPYKGKGVRYEDEIVRRKQGKALTGAA